MAMKRVVMYWALAGALLPSVLLVVGRFTILGPEALVLWPSSFLLMAPHGHLAAWKQFLLLAFSVAINVVLYSAVGSILFLLFGRRGK
jgi:hypothetical protein